MPISWDKAKGQWRFHFNRVIEAGHRRIRSRASRLLPKGWSRTQAEAYKRKREAELYALASGVDQPRFLITEAVRIFMEERLPDLIGKRKTAQELARLLPYYEGRELAELPEVAAAYRRDHVHLAAATVRNRLAYLRAACRYAVKTYRWPVPMPEAPTPTVRNRRQVYLRHDEQLALLECFTERDARALFTLAYFTGARWMAEILPRAREDIHYIEGDLFLDIGLTKNGTHGRKFVPPEAHWALAHLPFEYAERYFRLRWRRAAAQAGHPDMVPHDQRHSVASLVLATGGTLADVMQVLGHKSMAAAERYSHLYPEHAAQVLKRIFKRRA